MKPMLLVVVAIVFLAATAYALEEKFYEVTLNYKNGALSVEEITVKTGSLSQKADEGSYTAQLISFDESVLYSKKFEIITVIRGENFDLNTGTIAASEMKLNETNITLQLPYFAEGKQVNIYNKNIKALEIPVLQFADTCGNAVCDPQESYESCNKDCKSGGKDDYCDSVSDGVCDSDCADGQDGDCAVAAQQDYGRYLAAVVAAGGLLVILLVFRMRRKNQAAMKRILGKIGQSQ